MTLRMRERGLGVIAKVLILGICLSMISILVYDLMIYGEYRFLNFEYLFIIIISFSIAVFILFLKARLGNRIPRGQGRLKSW